MGGFSESCAQWIGAVSVRRIILRHVHRSWCRVLPAVTVPALPIVPGGWLPRYPHPMHSICRRQYFHEWSVKQEYVLLYNADIGAQRLQRHILHRNAVNGDMASIYIIEARDQAAQCGFARSGGSNQCNRLPGLNLQIDLFQCRLMFTIGKANIMEKRYLHLRL